MEQQGLLKRWDDEQGFGFIQPLQGGAEVFAHISAMRGDRRPVSGDRVMYIASKDGRGRLHAEHVRVAGSLALDQPAIRTKPKSLDVPVARARKPKKTSSRRESMGPVKNLALKLLVLTLLCSLPLSGAIQLLLDSGFIWALAVYPVASVISFVQYWQDKASAQKGRWRTSESTLHFFELLGGWPGALLAQQCFRHKTRKVSFQLLFWMIVAAHQAFWLDWLLLDGTYFTEFVRVALPH
jgi:uncharacterized membrane protein YsdA (DUF1294 family)/cold shock CspA family protein